MANKKISDLTAITPDVDDADIFEVSVWTGSAFTSRKVTFAEFRKSLIESVYIPISDLTSDLAIATDLNYIMFPYAITVVDVGATVITAPTGSVATFDINDGGTSILSTKITIDASEFTSETAATAPVISDTAIAANVKITFDIDGVGSTVAGAGAVIRIDYTRD